MSAPAMSSVPSPPPAMPPDSALVVACRALVACVAAAPSLPGAQEALRLAAKAIEDAQTPTLDLVEENWAALVRAAQESRWIPQDYYTVNDWMADVCAFLRDRGGDCQIQPPASGAPVTVQIGEASYQLTGVPGSGAAAVTSSYSANERIKEELAKSPPAMAAADALEAIVLALYARGNLTPRVIEALQPGFEAVERVHIDVDVVPALIDTSDAPTCGVRP